MKTKFKMSSRGDLNDAERGIAMIEETVLNSVYRICGGEEFHFDTQILGRSDEMRSAMEAVNRQFITDLRAALLKYRQGIVDYVENVMGVEYDYSDFKEAWENFLGEE